ncbi:hypothetical protein [Flavobacterium sp.]|uniref:hypothetical protein n=1 Tax=Flavobacterium sp. TaxID=239 RepID=UPI0025B7B72F|nr:hypothetical protein [Flavobacterium sp.]MBA4277302.1 hypothetical protein [Flavobacterium sp.]
MDKIIKALILLGLFTVSCSEKTNYYDKNTNNIKFIIEKRITIDLKNEKLYLNHFGLKYEDTIIFTESEKNNIISFFNTYNLNDKRGEFWYIDENSTSASLHDEIIILRNNKIKLRYIINEYHSVDGSYFENEETKIVKYRNLIKSIILNKDSYKRAEDSLRIFIKRKPVWLM